MTLRLPPLLPLLPLLAALALGGSAAAQQKPPAKPADRLLQGFLNPPPEARMRMYWRVFGPAWTRQGIDHQLALLKEAGVGGVMLMPFYPVAVDDPAKGIHNQPFLSKKFLETFGYAARKAKALGLRFSVQGGTGWPFGGPTVTLQDAAQRIRRVEVKPQDGRYTLPALREGERALAAWRGKERLDPAQLSALSHADLVSARHSEQRVNLIFPKIWRPVISNASLSERRNPAGDYAVGSPPDFSVASYAVRSGEPAALHRNDDARHTRVGRKSRAYTAFRMTGWPRDTHIQGSADGGTEPVTLFITGPTNMKVKRPALGADGYVLDHYNAPALERWLDANVKPLLDAAPGLVESIFCDSLEVYNANWTHDFPQEFRTRRGYDLIPRLQEMYDENAPASPDLRFDYWRTLAELNEERFTIPLSRWAKKHGVKLEMEAYGTPPSPLTSFRHIDVPTGEQYEWMGFSFSRYASSGGHLAGKRVIGAEAWTWTGLPNRLIDSLRDLKLVSDYHFLAGVNDLTGVDFAYSPPGVAPPGWLPYYGPVMNQNNPQWPYFKYLVRYVNRCQWLLRQGKPVAQVAIYLPVEQTFAHGPLDQMLLDFHLRDHFVTGEKTGEFGLENARKHRSELIHTLVTHGYNFDGIDFWTLIRHARVKNGKLICGDGEYSIVILPNLEGMELEALEKLAEFVRSGGVLVATDQVPQRTFGLSVNHDVRSRRFGQLIERIFGPKTSAHEYQRRFGNGVVVFGASNLNAFLQPSIDNNRGDGLVEKAQYLARSQILDSDLTCVVRHVNERQVFFLVNWTNNPSISFVRLRPGKLGVRELDPVTGRVSDLLPVHYTQDGLHSVVVVSLARYGSTFLISEPLHSRHPPGGDNLTTAEPVRSRRPLRVTWQVTFSGPSALAAFQTDNLISWTQYPGGKYFSGHTTYETTFDWSEPLHVILREPQATEESALRMRPKGRKADSSARIASPRNDGKGRRANLQNEGHGRSVKLRFGEVREAGEVWVNGKLAGGVWLPPYEVEIGPLLKPGKNTLKVTVGNTMLNRFLGLPDEDLRPLRAAYGSRFPDPEEKRLTKEPPPSGLIGPVEVVRE